MTGPVSRGHLSAPHLMGLVEVILLLGTAVVRKESAKNTTGTLVRGVSRQPARRGSLQTDQLSPLVTPQEPCRPSYLESPDARAHSSAHVHAHAHAHSSVISGSGLQRHQSSPVQKCLQTASAGPADTGFGVQQPEQDLESRELCSLLLGHGIPVGELVNVCQRLATLTGADADARASVLQHTNSVVDRLLVLLLHDGGPQHAQHALECSELMQAAAHLLAHLATQPDCKAALTEDLPTLATLLMHPNAAVAEKACMVRDGGDCLVHLSDTLTSHSLTTDRPA